MSLFTLGGDPPTLAFPDVAVWQGFPSEPAPVHGLPIVLEACEEGHIRQRPQDWTDSILNRYASREYAYATTPPGISEWGDSRGSEVLEFLGDAGVDARGRRILEIGAGTAHIARRLLSEGNAARYVIFDPSIRDVSTDSRLVIERRPFDHQALDGETFDLVLCLSAIEHLPDPGGILAAVRQALSPGGAAVFLLPEETMSFQGGDFNLLFHEHLSHFTALSFEALALSRGLATAYSHVKENGLYSLLRAAQPSSALTGQALVESRELLRGAPRPFERAFEAFRALIDQARADNLRVGLHGATNGLNILLHALKSSPAQLDNLHLFDADPYKTGRFLPAFPRPVLSTDDPLYSDMDWIVVAAMTYYGPIAEFARNRRGFSPERIVPLIPGYPGIRKAS